jgi:hypothetical protein
MRYSGVAEKKMALVVGRDYPGTYREFVEMFPDDAACTQTT